MAGTSLLLLLDDIATILDDVSVMTKVAAKKTAGVLGDDLALNAQQVAGIKADRELPVVWAVAKGSLRNKLILVPSALAISALAPWAVLPLLMLGGAYLCFEGFEKIAHKWLHGKAEEQEHHQHLVTALANPALDMVAFEKDKIRGAIRTDFILSAEIMAITLASVPDSGFVTQALVLALVGIGITAAVYGVVALIVKADDVGVALANNGNASAFGSLSRGLGRALVRGMPYFLTFLSAAGTAAMIWVGGGIIVHGLEHYGYTAIGHAIHSAAEATAHAVPLMSGAVEWIVNATGAGVAGLVVGAILFPLTGYAIAPLWKTMKGLIRPARTA